MTSLNIAEATPGDSVAERIRAARTRVGLSQEAFAEKVGTSRRHVMRWESGQHTPTPEFARRIAEATGTKPEQFSDAEGDAEDD